MSVIWLNGEFCEEDSFSIPSTHLGLSMGEGIFETLLGIEGKPFAVQRHLDRLKVGAIAFGFDVPSQRTISEGFEELMKLNQLATAKLRLTIAASLPGQSALVLMTATPLPDFPDSYALVTVPYTRNETGALVGLKSTSYAENILALKRALKEGGDDAILGNTQGMLCEGTSFNLFVKYDGQWVTPPLSAGPLGGVTRALVIELAEKSGIEILEQDTPLSQLASAEEAFLTSSLRCIRPVHSIDGRSL